MFFFFNFYYTPLFIQVKVSLRFKSHFQEGPGIVAAKVTKHDNIATIRTNMGKIRNSRSLRATFKTVTLTKSYSLPSWNALKLLYGNHFWQSVVWCCENEGCISCSLNTCKHTDRRKRAKERFIVKNQPMGKSVDILYRDGHLTAAYREQWCTQFPQPTIKHGR